MIQHKLWYQSSYDRGLEHLLKMWPEIKKRVPDAELGIAYGWNLFEKVYRTNPERMAWKDKMDKLMQAEGITHYGRIGQEKLRQTRREHGVWVYPSHFQEINCIGALEAQSDGLVPVVTNFAALKETVGSGVKVEGDIYLKETREKFLEELVSLMNDPKRWEAESKKAVEFAQSYSWDLVALEWSKEFK